MFCEEVELLRNGRDILAIAVSGSMQLDPRERVFVMDIDLRISMKL